MSIPVFHVIFFTKSKGGVNMKKTFLTLTLVLMLIISSTVTFAADCCSNPNIKEFGVNPVFNCTSCNVGLNQKCYEAGHEFEHVADEVTMWCMNCYDMYQYYVDPK